MKNIVVVPYDAAWPAEFQKIKNELLPQLTGLIIAIEHVGSTSVEGLAAKPIIDIDIVIDPHNMRAVIGKLGQIGYEHEGDLGIAGREAFKYSEKPHLMKHNLYVCPADSAEYQRHVAFRDYLRLHREDRDRYGAVKTEMAKRHPLDIDRYIQGKEGVVMEIYAKCGIPPWK